MATRCNIILCKSNYEHGEPEFVEQEYIYRHWDGYPEETGSHLEELLEAYQTNFKDNHINDIDIVFNDLCNYIVNSKENCYKKEHILSGDIEFAYIIHICKDKKATIRINLFCVPIPLDYRRVDSYRDKVELLPYFVELLSLYLDKEINEEEPDFTPALGRYGLILFEECNNMCHNIFRNIAEAGIFTWFMFDTKLLGSFCVL